MHIYVIQCCRTGVPSGVVQMLLSIVTKDAGRLVGCLKCLDQKQQSSCERWLWLSVAHSVCRRQPTSDANVQQAQPLVGKAQPDMGVLVPADTCWPASWSCILSPGGLKASGNPAGLTWCGQICVFRWSAVLRHFELAAFEWRSQQLQPVDYCSSLSGCWWRHGQVSWLNP